MPFPDTGKAVDRTESRFGLGAVGIASVVVDATKVGKNVVNAADDAQREDATFAYRWFALISLVALVIMVWLGWSQKTVTASDGMTIIGFPALFLYLALSATARLNYLSAFRWNAARPKRYIAAYVNSLLIMAPTFYFWQLSLDSAWQAYIFILIVAESMFNLAIIGTVSDIYKEMRQAGEDPGMTKRQMIAATYRESGMPRVIFFRAAALSVALTLIGGYLVSK